ncbi:hypothetical protein KOW79_011663 [Hemibagrus wyckioides]|uniref:5'-nucleotidase n=1 Tax=Hemibagrus wyckioides TaxID=337641 RepID=A0A9D3NNA2_9TELE|nr:hypothetical protein KOW79_011663 [Hemibagrus wyckioides]
MVVAKTPTYVEFGGSLFPIEINSSKSVEEKIPHMVEWSVITPSLTLRFILPRFAHPAVNQESPAGSGCERLGRHVEGVACAFKGELIYSFNKRERALQNTHQFVHNRTNVLLLGDSMGDLDLAEGVQDLKNHIGYLNDKVEERREAYVSSYDIVLEEDETLDVPNAILNYITAGEGS